MCAWSGLACTADELDPTFSYKTSATEAKHRLGRGLNTKIRRQLRTSFAEYAFIKLSNIKIYIEIFYKWFSPIIVIGKLFHALDMTNPCMDQGYL